MRSWFRFFFAFLKRRQNWSRIMTHLRLKLAILERYPTQADFAAILNEQESKVSRVIRGRVLLKPEEAEIWREHLNCDRALLDPVVFSK
jgi:hypothetical protein